MTTDTKNPQVSQQLPVPGYEHKLLDMFIGKWINEGCTIASEDTPAVKILTSDVYEWLPGGFFVLHSAYGRIGNIDAGGVEILSYDSDSQRYRSHFFDSQGNITVDDLVINGNTCTWAGKKVRTTAVFTDNGKTQRAYHQRLDESGNWVAAMDVTLRKVQ